MRRGGRHWTQYQKRRERRRRPGNGKIKTKDVDKGNSLARLANSLAERLAPWLKNQGGDLSAPRIAPEAHAGSCRRQALEAEDIGGNPTDAILDTLTATGIVDEDEDEDARE